MTTVVDTNIVFSALLNTDSLIASILFNPTTTGFFYSLDFLKHEIINREEKLVKYSQLSTDQLRASRALIYQRIMFVSPDEIDAAIWQQAYQLCHDVDENDTPFVALTLHLNGELWTGDRKLSNGLRQKGFSQIISTGEVNKLITEL